MPPRLRPSRLTPPYLAAAVFRRTLLEALGRRQLGVAAALVNIRHACPGFFQFSWENGAPQHETVASLEFRGDRCVLGLNRDLAGTRLRYVLGRLIPLFGLLAGCRGEAAGSIALNLEDFGLVPGLAFSDCEPDRPLIPDPIYLSQRGYRRIARHYLKNDVPWPKRKDVALWRGSTTGMEYVPGNWRAMERVRLCAIAQSRPDLFDVGLAGIVQMNAADRADVLASGLMRDFIPETEFIRWRYQIDIDGNSNSWPGLFQKLLTGSPVLKVASRRGYRQWYYDRLAPWENFVPVETDMSDLVEKVEWLKGHDAEARRIGAAGRALALSMSFDEECANARRTIVSALRKERAAA